MPWRQRDYSILFGLIWNSLDLMYLWSKVVCFVLFCFVLVVMLRSPKTTMLHAALLMSLESSWWIVGCTHLVWDSLKLLINESFSQWKLNQLKTQNYIGIWGHSWSWKGFRKALNGLDLIEFISQSCELRCKRYWFLSDSCCWKFK